MWRTKIRKEKKRYFRIVTKIIKYTTEFANYSLKSDFICVRITLYSYDIRVIRSLHTGACSYVGNRPYDGIGGVGSTEQSAGIIVRGF